MTAKHTPGPWREGERGMIEAASREGTLSEAVGAVAFVYGPFDPHGRANAKLISAAPDLLDALEEYHRVASAVPYAQWTPAMHKAQDAIAKARGQG